jgi:putative restriction endonuclease
VARRVAERLGFEVFVSSAAAASEAERRTISESVHFDPKSTKDGRTRILMDIVRRQGQAGFRNKVLSAYGGRCAISGCNVPEVLDAAHIAPYRGPATNHVTNGILLRADLHTLFDLLLVAVNPKSMMVEVSPRLRGSAYCQFHGRTIGFPSTDGLRPNREALEKHRLESDAE